MDVRNGQGTVRLRFLMGHDEAVHGVRLTERDVALSNVLLCTEPLPLSLQSQYLPVTLNWPNWELLNYTLHKQKSSVGQVG